MNTILEEIICHDPQKVDLLNRQNFVEKLLYVSDMLSKGRKNACYAINGSWGVGKSFVLDMFEKQNEIINDGDSALSRYAIFRYNCWEYDYYEEPLIAIVATLLNDIDSKTNLLSQKVKIEAKEVLKSVGKCFVKKAFSLIENKTGLPATEIAEIAKEAIVNTNERIDEEQSFDQQITFKSNINKLRETIHSLSNEQTVMFIVDELDRCIPEYTIKVLERLHHIFDDIPNVQVVISVDKGQLEHTIRQIYGEHTNVDRYLAKFIDFELNLVEGSFSDSDKLFEVFAEYTNFFEEDPKCVDTSEAKDFLNLIFEGIDMRSRIAIISKCTLLHEMLSNHYSNNTFIHMCVELLLSIVNHANLDLDKSFKNFSVRELFVPKTEKEITEGLRLLREKYNSQIDYITSANYSYHFINISDLWGVLLLAYRYIIGIKNDRYNPAYIGNIDVTTYAQAFWELQQIVC